MKPTWCYLTSDVRAAFRQTPVSQDCQKNSQARPGMPKDIQRHLGTPGISRNHQGQPEMPNDAQGLPGISKLLQRRSGLFRTLRLDPGKPQKMPEVSEKHCFSELLKAPRGVSKIRGDFPELHMKAKGGPGSQGLPDYPGSSEDLGVHRI